MRIFFITSQSKICCGFINGKVNSITNLLIPQTGICNYILQISVTQSMIARPVLVYKHLVDCDEINKKLRGGFINFLKYCDIAVTSKCVINVFSKNISYDRLEIKQNENNPGLLQRQFNKHCYR